MTAGGDAGRDAAGPFGVTEAQPDGARGEAVLALHAERLSVSRRVVETAVVRATRTTAMRDEAVTEDLAQEEVAVERVAIGRVVDAIPEVRQDGETTVFPVVEEVLVVERRLVLKEEVRVTRVRSTRQHVETVSLRSQDATVTRTEIGALPPEATVAAARPSHTGSTQLPTDKGYSTMDGETLVAVYDTPAHAALAVADLKLAGVPDSAITSHAGDTGATSVGAAPVREEGFWAGLFGGEPDRDATVYDRSLASGSTVVTVRGSEAYSSKAAEILESHHPVDMDERASGYRMAETTTSTAPVSGIAAAATATGDTIQLSEERLSVGKRVVNRGGTRIRRYVVETPVEENVTLHEERVTLERRPVTDGRPVTNADFTDKTIEMTETAEEVVVAKQAFVTEEIALKKTATDRVETVRDTVRKEDVEVVEIPGETVTTTAGPMKPLDPRNRK